MSDSTMTGQVRVTMRDASCYGGRRIHLEIGGLPGWLLGLIAEAGPFKREASTYGCGPGRDDSGPYSLLLGSTLVVATTEPAPQPVPKVDAEPEAGL